LCTTDSTTITALISPSLAWAQLETGDIAGALTATDRVLGQAANGSRLHIPEALRIRGMALARQGRTEEAEGAFVEGLEAARSMPFPYAEARILREYGKLDLAHGREREGRERMAQALEIFQRLGAAKDVEGMRDPVLVS
jgi:hypothetical protein